MLNLNLISQEDKDMFQFMLYRRVVFWFGSAAGTGVIVFIILLIPSFLFLNFQRQEILRELAVEEEALKTLGVVGIEQRILSVNTNIGRVQALADGEDRASRILDGIASLAGPVKIGAVKVDFLKESIEIDGIAPTRNALLLFERSLEESDFIVEVSAPLSDLVKLVDVAFTLKGALK